MSHRELLFLKVLGLEAFSVHCPENKKGLPFGKPLFCLVIRRDLNPGPQHYEKAPLSLVAAHRP
jgi:hypothetical protein